GGELADGDHVPGPPFGQVAAQSLIISPDSAAERGLATGSRQCDRRVPDRGQVGGVADRSRATRRHSTTQSGPSSPSPVLRARLVRDEAGQLLDEAAGVGARRASSVAPKAPLSSSTPSRDSTAAATPRSKGPRPAVVWPRLTATSAP